MRLEHLLSGEDAQTMKKVVSIDGLKETLMLLVLTLSVFMGD